MIPTLDGPDSDRLAPLSLPVTPVTHPDLATSLETRVSYLLSAPHESLPQAAQVLDDLKTSLAEAVRRAVLDREEDALLDFHKALYAIYELSTVNPFHRGVRHERSAWLAAVREPLEAAWLRAELELVVDSLPSPRDTRSPKVLSAWFEETAAVTTPLDTMVVDYLAREANLEEFRLFVLSDGPLNLRFFDLLTMAQVHYSERVKAEISNHLHDECGLGDPEAAHTRQFGRALETLGVTLPLIPVWEDWRPYAGINLQLAYAQHREHYFKALGSHAMPELFDSQRDEAVVAGLNRLGMDVEYYFNHMEGDRDHGPSWLDRVVLTVVRTQPEAGWDLAVGAATRMTSMRRYNQYLAAQFGLAE